MPVPVDLVAQRAGVSISTVSRALRGVSGISEATRKRVRNAALELGYVPSVAASRLATGKTGAVAVATPTLSKWFFGQVLGTAGRVLREGGYDVLLYEVPDAVQRQKFFASGNLQGRVDGVLCLALQPTSEEMLALAGQGLPTVLLGALKDKAGSVQVDDRSAGRDATRHLLNLGHQRVAFVGITEAQGTTLGGVPPARRRLGYRDAMAEAGLTPGPGHEVLEANTIAGGAAAMTQLLCAEIPPTAVFFASDEMAFGGLHTLRKSGVRVPEEMSVVGFDNHELSDVLDLTTMDHSVPEQGQAAAELLLARLDHEGPAETSRVIPTRLIIRASTAPPRSLRPGMQETTP